MFVPGKGEGVFHALTDHSMTRFLPTIKAMPYAFPDYGENANKMEPTRS